MLRGNFKMGDRVRVNAGANIGRTGVLTHYGRNQTRGFATVKFDGDPLPTQSQTTEDLKRAGITYDAGYVSYGFLTKID